MYEMLGEGAFSTVRLAVHRRSGKHPAHYRDYIYCMIRGETSSQDY